jgi:DNA-binding Lrp family transcriptional regulator
MPGEGVALATGFVLIRTAPKKEHDVFDGVRALKEVSEVYNVFGDCDIVAKVVAEDYQRIGDVVVDIIRSTKGIVWTKTLVSVSFENSTMRRSILGQGHL